jgi:uncharacterized protein YneF (UPF0154 family)
MSYIVVAVIVAACGVIGGMLIARNNRKVMEQVEERLKELLQKK